MKLNSTLVTIVDGSALTGEIAIREKEIKAATLYVIRHPTRNLYNVHKWRFGPLPDAPVTKKTLNKYIEQALAHSES